MWGLILIPSVIIPHLELSTEFYETEWNWTEEEVEEEEEEEERVKCTCFTKPLHAASLIFSPRALWARPFLAELQTMLSPNTGLRYPSS